MPRTHIFHGPSLTAAEVGHLLPRALSHPPVRHGDLLELDSSPGDRVVILDGVFHHAPAVRHKEICALISAGGEVWGAASIGALRAAELRSVGMRGSGMVFHLYTRGVIERDDEVALIHTDPEHGSTPLTTALITVRVLCRRLRRDKALRLEEETAIVGAAQELHFTERSWRAVLDRAGIDGVSRRTVEQAIAGPRPTWDVKAQDAARLLRCLATYPTPPRVAGTGPSARPVPRTVHVERWLRRARPADDRLVAAAAIYGWDYPAFYRRVVLALIAGRADPVDAALQTDDALAADAIASARRLRVLPPGVGDDALTAVVRAFHWAGSLAPTPVLAAAVRVCDGAAKVDAFVQDAASLNDALQQRGHRLDDVSAATLERHLRVRWTNPAATAVSPRTEDRWDDVLADRGFADDADLHDRAGWFTPQLVIRQPDPVTLHGLVDRLRDE